MRTWWSGLRVCLLLLAALGVAACSSSSKPRSSERSGKRWVVDKPAKKPRPRRHASHDHPHGAHPHGGGGHHHHPHPHPHLEGADGHHHPY